MLFANCETSVDGGRNLFLKLRSFSSRSFLKKNKATTIITIILPRQPPSNRWIDGYVHMRGIDPLLLTTVRVFVCTCVNTVNNCDACVETGTKQTKHMILILFTFFACFRVDLRHKIRIDCVWR